MCQNGCVFEHLCMRKIPHDNNKSRMESLFINSNFLEVEKLNFCIVRREKGVKGVVDSMKILITKVSTNLNFSNKN